MTDKYHNDAEHERGDDLSKEQTAGCTAPPVSALQRSDAVTNRRQADGIAPSVLDKSELSPSNREPPTNTTPTASTLSAAAMSQVATEVTTPLPQRSTESHLLNAAPASNQHQSVTDPDTAQATLRRILSVAEELGGQCRVCWFRGEIGKPHYTYYCKTGICSGTEWKSFKLLTKFPANLVCYLCYSLYGPPFNHANPPAGTKYKGDLCDNPDILKELTYIVYQDVTVRNAVFARLNESVPTTLTSYWRFIGKKRVGGLLGVYEVLAAYLELRETQNLVGHNA